MSLLSDYRKRIRTLLAADDIRATLELEGVTPVIANAIGISRAVTAQSSVIRRLKVSDNPENKRIADKEID